MRIARLEPALVAVLSGIVAALHVGKIPPAIPVLSESLGMTLVEAGFLLSMVQLAGMLTGTFVGVAADAVGLRRSILVGQCILAVASLLGAWARQPADLLMLRALEGFGFLLVVLPTPSLIRRLVDLRRLALYLGLWGTYMPTGAAVALFFGPMAMAFVGWQGWWSIMGALSAGMAAWLYTAVPADAAERPAEGMAESWWQRLKLTLGSAGPWRVALAFGMYSAQWLAVIGFLPSIYAQAGFGAQLSGSLTALASLANVIGNIAAGRLLHRGTQARMLIYVGFGSLSAAAFFAFSGLTADLPTVRYLAVVAFSAFGGLIPGTLFSLAVQAAPNDRCVSTTLGWVQQCSAAGQFLGPPLVALLASKVGGWEWTWAATMTASLIGLLMAKGCGLKN